MRLLAVILMMFLPLTFAMAGDYREASWDDLMPEGWEPAPPEMLDDFGGFGEAFGESFDGSDVREVAPVVGALNNQKLKIPGYVIPIKFEEQGILEFLLVPFVGACVHVPPPPENQMVYVSLKEPLVAAELWEPVWVNGVMTTQVAQTEYATAGYHMKDAYTETYEY